MDDIEIVLELLPSRVDLVGGVGPTIVQHGSELGLRRRIVPKPVVDMHVDDPTALRRLNRRDRLELAPLGRRRCCTRDRHETGERLVEKRAAIHGAQSC